MTQPHDLILINHARALSGDLPEWVAEQWSPALPLVVRRDYDPAGRIPVGVRGKLRHQRAAAWIEAQDIDRVIAPETFSDVQLLQRSSLREHPVLQAALRVAQQHWPWAWGITGGAGYALATGINVLHDRSDLDLLIRTTAAPELSELLRWQQFLGALPCRVDTQIAVPDGGFALNEWLRDGRVLLKTDRGPRLTAHPWESL